LKLAALILALFGLLTLFMGGSVIFDLFDMRQKEGNFVLFVVWTNFICGFIYLFAAYSFFNYKKWTITLLIITVLILVLTLTRLLYYINIGGIYETKTIGAMLFRIAMTIVFILLAYFKISKRQVSINN